MEPSSKRVLLAASCAAGVLSGSLWLALREERAPVASIASNEADRAQVDTSAVVDFSLAVEAPESRELVEPPQREQTSAQAHAAREDVARMNRFLVSPPACAVSGRVVDAAGQPVRGAQISLGVCSGKSSGDGSFVLTLEAWEVERLRPETPLVARRSLMQPALVESYGARVLAAPAAMHQERLVLREELSISARIVDANGGAVSRGRVRIVDGTPLEPGIVGSKWLEDRVKSFESNASFKLADLLPRSYVLECELQRPFASFRTAPIPAGSNSLEIRVPADALIDSVHGYLVTSDGSPLADAKLDLAFEVEPRVWWPTRSLVGGVPPVTTSSGGAFVLREVPSSNAWVVVEHPGVPAQALALAGFDLRSEITLVARRRARLQFEKFDESLPGLTFDLLDRSGSPAPWEPSPGETAYLSGAVIALDGGRSKPLTTIEGRYTLVVSSVGTELVRREIELVAERTTAIGP